jgi:hypothetical protein
MEDEPAPPASLVAHGRKNHRFDRWVTGPDRRTQANRSLRKTALRRLPKVASTFGPCARNAINDNPAPTAA